MKNKTTLIIGGIVVFIILLVIIGGSGQNNISNQAQNSSGDVWYYINQNYQCVKTTSEYKNEDTCAKDVDTYCHNNDPTCGGVKKLTLYYIDPTNHCVLAPHNPYSPLESRDIDGNFAEQNACKKDVGQDCYVDDSTCGGAGTAGVVTINGVAYKLVTPQELEQNINNNSSSTDNGGSASLVAVKGTIYDYRYDSALSMPYTLVINSGGNYVVVLVGNKDPNTQSPNGFDVANFPKGTNVIAAGVSMNNFYLGYFLPASNYGLSAPMIKWLESLGLPKNTPIISSGMGVVKKAP